MLEPGDASDNCISSTVVGEGIVGLALQGMDAVLTTNSLSMASHQGGLQGVTK